MELKVGKSQCLSPNDTECDITENSRIWGRNLSPGLRTMRRSCLEDVDALERLPRTDASLSKTQLPVYTPVILANNSTPGQRCGSGPCLPPNAKSSNGSKKT